jgi:hypothetical protein
LRILVLWGQDEHSAYFITPPNTTQFSDFQRPSTWGNTTSRKVLLTSWPDHHTNENCRSLLRKSPRQLLGKLVGHISLVSKRPTFDSHRRYKYQTESDYKTVNIMTTNHLKMVEQRPPETSF